MWNLPFMCEKRYNEIATLYLIIEKIYNPVHPSLFRIYPPFYVQTVATTRVCIDFILYTKPYTLTVYINK